MNLDRLMTLLETVASAGRPLATAEIQSATRLPRPTCYRMVQTLDEQGLLQRCDDAASEAAWVLGGRFIRIAAMSRTDADIRLVTAPLLQQAATDTGDAYFFSRLKGRNVEIVQVETPKADGAAFIHPGLGRRPMHACSCSKVIAAFADESLQARIVNGPLKSYTDNTHADANAVEREFAAIRRSGFAECVEELEVGIVSVAAPVHLHALHGAPFSVGAIGPVRRFTPKRRRQVGAQLIELAGRISDRIDPGVASPDEPTGSRHRPARHPCAG